MTNDSLSGISPFQIFLLSICFAALGWVMGFISANALGRCGL